MPTTLVRLLISLLSRSNMLLELTFLASSLGNARKVSEVFKTITADNGSEFLDGESIRKAANCEEVYYAHPYSSWERGSNENGNRILRRFVPKGIDIARLTAKELERIEDWVNNYPRRIHGYRTANEMAA